MPSSFVIAQGNVDRVSLALLSVTKTSHPVTVLVCGRIHMYVPTVQCSSITVETSPYVSKGRMKAVVFLMNSVCMFFIHRNLESFCNPELEMLLSCG